MKYLPLADFDTVTNALNFSTPDCHVIGGCDLYTTKAARSDKKLYKDIDAQLESQYQSLLSASLSPPPNFDDSADETPYPRKRSRTIEPPKLDLSRNSPFGPLSQITARRTFAYLIATLNASHSDYDFSSQLQPSDFRKERSLRAIMQNVDGNLQALQPKQAYSYLSPPTLSSGAPPALANSAGAEIWSPRMWSLIDYEMSLRQCEKYSYAPSDDPFDEGALWSMHYFFFSKERKRVCYLYLRGLSVISHSPIFAAPRSVAGARPVSVGEGAGKRASYWLGARQGDVETDGEEDNAAWNDDDDDDDDAIYAGDDEIEVPYMDLDDIRGSLVDGYYGYEGAEEEDEGDEEGDVYMEEERQPAGVRGVSEEIGDEMEI